MRINIFEDRLGRELGVPVLAARGENVEPVLGITAAVHGNEINGIPVIHKIFQKIANEKLNGTLIAIPVVNVPGYLAYQRNFIDDTDLNRIFPGKESGTPAQEYASHFMTQIVEKFNFMLDLHTASFGRINSHYVRADLTSPKVKELADLQHTQIIVHTTGPANSLRSAAMSKNIPALTLELGNPQSFQKEVVNNATISVLNVLSKLEIIKQEIKLPNPPMLCENSYWVRCHDGGILTVHPDLVQQIAKDEKIATLVDLYGRKDLEYTSPESGVVIGKNINPVVSTGSRILHLGVLSQVESVMEFK